MTQKEILEYNKRCAEFLEWELQPITALHNFREGSWKGKNGINHFDLKFHSDWNWMMEVVKAIEKLGYVSSIYKNGVEHCSGFLKDKEVSWIVLSKALVKEEAVVQAINKFLIWYNENK